MGVSSSDTDADEHSRTTIGRLEQWLLLNGNRFVIAIGVAVTFGIAYLALTMANVAPLTETQPLFYALSGLVSGNMTLITVVVSSNQLLLSRELQTPDELESEIEATVDYRREVEAVTNRAAPSSFRSSSRSGCSRCRCSSRISCGW
ncbi:hypothetical protein [Natrinema marinum]|uniref:hypothetical protein n=1 Tax=Natrinema marinum TaxID=2961598 RepID=UPI0020C898FD|nr:hypothetical protein [Natrinema marinum]